MRKSIIALLLVFAVALIAAIGLNIRHTVDSIMAEKSWQDALNKFEAKVEACDHIFRRMIVEKEQERDLAMKMHGCDTLKKEYAAIQVRRFLGR